MTSTESVPEAVPGAAGGSAGGAPLIAVRLFAAAAAELGADALEVRARSLAELVAQLLEGRAERAERVIARSSFLINAVACTDRERPLVEGDRVDVLPPFAGG